MKEWMKKNKFAVLGNFFVWIIPIILLLVFGYTGKEKGHWSVWALVGIVIFAFIYYVALKKKIDHRQEKAIDKNGYAPIWCIIIKWFILMLPFVGLLLVSYSVKSDIDNLISFILTAMGSITLGYVFLVLDSNYKKTIASK